jgi:hypothetical protein
MNFVWLVIIFVRLVFRCVVWLRTRTCGYLVMFYNYDLGLFILWLVLVLVVVFEANPSLIFSDIYMWLLPWSLFCRETLSKFIMFYVYVQKSNVNYMHICRGSSLYILVLETFTLSIYWIYLRRVSESKTQNLSYTTPLNGCHQLPKRGRLKASRPLIRVLVINNNHYGLTILFELWE